VDSFTGLVLPSDADDRAVVQLRWALWRGTMSGSSSGIALDNISITGSEPELRYFRTAQSGYWRDTTTWEISSDSADWQTADAWPSYRDHSIVIRSGHTVSLSQADTLDQLTVNGTLTFSGTASGTPVIHDGAGIDLVVNGTFRDNGPSSIVWLGSASWAMGAYGTLERTRSTSSNNWRDRYAGGIATIPATAHWAVRKTGSDSPAITTTGGMVYPNLTIENHTGSAWVTGSQSSFTGFTDRPIVKGDLNIGGEGPQAVSFLNANMHANPVQVQGRLIVQAGSTLRSHGTGFEAWGDVTIAGVYDPDTGHAVLTLAGNGAQWLTSADTLRLSQLRMDKSSGDAKLAAIMQVADTLHLTSGVLTATGNGIVILKDDALAVGASDASYVEGRVLKVGDDAFVFPVGRNGKYRPIGMSAPSSGSAEFLAEYFEGNSDWTYRHEDRDGTIAEIGRNEYWTLERIESASTVSVTLTWHSDASCAFEEATDLLVAAYDGSDWKDLGNGGTTGDAEAGTVVTSGASTVYGAYAMGTTDAFACRQGASCLEPYDLSTGDSCLSDISLKGDRIWFRFMADSAHVKLTFENMAHFGLDTALIYMECGPDADEPVLATCYPMGSKLIVMAYGLEAEEEHFLLLKGASAQGSGADMCKMPFYHRNGNECEIEVPPLSAPEVAWRSVTWAPIRPDNGLPQTLAESNEDWWYHHINSYDAEGMLNGFLGVGYSGFDNYQISEAADDGCFVSGLVDGQYQNIHATAGLISPCGSAMRWFTTFAEGDFYEAIQAPDGGYIAVGRTSSTRTKTGSPLYYNPTSTNPEDYFSSSLGHCANGQRHAYVVKMDAQGNPVWEHIYGMPEFATDPALAYRCESQVYDIVEMENGNFRIVGFARLSFNGIRHLFILDIDPSGEVVSKVAYNPQFVQNSSGTFGQGAYGYAIAKVVEGENVSYAVTGSLNQPGFPSGCWTSYYPGTGHYRKRAYFWSFDDQSPPAQLALPVVFQPPFSISGPMTNTVAYDIAVNAEGKVILPVLDECEGCCVADGNGRAVIHQLNPDGTAHRPPLDLGSVGAYDFKMGVTATDDGGYAVVTTRQNPAGAISGYNQYSNSDAFVAKVNAENELEWETTFDEGLLPNGVDNPKKQECLYSITQTPDGGLVVAGNNSYFDFEEENGFKGDANYMAKLKSDCAQRQAYIAPNTTLTISTDQTWDYSRKIGSKVVVTSGRTLTVTGATTVVEFASSAGMAWPVNITVEPGGRLIVQNGATLTSLECCNETWDGIIVQGTPSAAPSLTVGGPHGQVHMHSGARVMNAKVGVRSDGGGIVRTYTNGGARPAFVNCRKAVELAPYTFDDGSQFTSTDFICDAPMVHYSYSWNGQPVGVNAFVTAYLHGRARFTGCNFTNALTSTSDAFHPQVRGLGIVAIDSKLKVTASEFTGLFRGVDVGRTVLGPGHLELGSSTFIDNMQGVLNQGSNLDRITDNTFIMPDTYFGEPQNIPAFGIYMFEGLGHHVKGNTFGDQYGGPTLSRGFINRGITYSSGIIQWNSGGMLRENKFYNTFIGTQVEQNNINLQMRCNEYTDVSADWVINWLSEGSILGPQGTGCQLEDYRAGNRFFDGGSNIWNRALPFYYAYTDEETEEKPLIASISLSINDDPCFTAPITATCPTANPCTGNPAPCIAVYDDAIALRRTEKEDLAAALDDNGTLTAGLLTDIADAGYSNATLTSDLIGAGLLSDQVLTAVCARTPFFSDAQFTTIIVHNSPVTRQVWEHVYPKIGWAGPYPETIIGAQRTDTLRTLRVIEKEIEIAESERFQLVMQRLDAFVDKDGTPDSTYLMIHWLTDSISGKQWQMLAVGTAIGLDTLEWAKDILTAMDLDNAEDSAFFALHNLSITLRQDTLTWFDMDSTQKALIIGLADGATLMRGYAETVLALLGDTSIMRTPEEFELPSAKFDGEEEDEEMPSAPSITKGTERIKVYPNPFSNTFSVQYELLSEAKEVRFEVFDLTGRLLLSETASGVQIGTRVLNLGQCKGFYLLRVTADDRRVKSEKLVCIEQ